MFHFCCRNCIIKKGNVTVPYTAIATRTRSKTSQKSLDDKEFQDFLNTMVTSTQASQNDVSSSESYTSSSSSSSSYDWSSESPDSVVPGSTSSSSDVDTSNHVVSDDYITDNPISDHNSVQGSSDGNAITSLPGFTQSVNTDLQVSLNLFFNGL